MSGIGNPNWQSGISGNPGGRSRELACQQNAARLKAAGHSIEAIEYLLDVMRDGNETTANRLKAAVDLLNRGIGLPTANVDVDILVRKKITEMSLTELQQLEDKLTALPPSPPLLEQHAVEQSNETEPA
jgi:hypothetical protein